jgi:hypothetical protein
MLLERNEYNSMVTYKRNGEIVGIIQYNYNAPSGGMTYELLRNTTGNQGAIRKKTSSNTTIF